jgi:sulfite oxidase
MSDHPSFSRRKILLAGGGLAVASIGSKPLVGDAPSLAAKDLTFLTTDPRNAEPALDKLVQSWITPTKYFYVRSHAPNPVIEATDFELSVEGSVRKPTKFKLAKLLAMKNQTVTATLTCAGNRRAEFNTEGKVGGVQWGPGAIGNATWTGIALADVLKQCEVTDDAKHVWFEGLDEITKDDNVIPFGGSIPISKAMQAGQTPGALLVHQMNDKPLSPDHGYPLRTVVPGYIGARSVKWLGKIVVSDRPSPNHYLATAYKIVKSTEAIDWTESGPIYRYPINAAIATPAPAATLSAGEIDVTGYVLPTGRLGARVSQIWVSSDNGASWTKANMTGQDADYCWQLWRASVRVSNRSEQLIMRAEDSSGGFMPQRVPWNAKGYLQNSWYRVPIQVS